MSMRKLSATLCLLSLLFVTAALTTAQDAESVQRIFAAAPKVPTSVGSVGIFQAPPKGFDPLTASWDELARYGLPQRPDAQAEPQRFAMWERGMRALASAKYHPVDVKAMPWHSSPMKPVNGPGSATATKGPLSNAPATVTSSNWSGVANTNKLTKWNTKTSFNFVESLFVVPSAYPPTGACANGITGPFLASMWNGIDGYSDGDVVQGGVAIYSDCGGPNDTSYAAWVEWYPSYPGLEIVCSVSPLIPCPVNPGDTLFVQTYGVAGKATQSVFVENFSGNDVWSGTFSLPYVSGPGLVGSSEEQIVERPCCNGADFYALNNYDFAYFASALGTDAAGTAFYVGEQSTATFILQMLDDAGNEVISEPVEQGSAGNAGKYMLWVSDEGCAYSGGCTP